MIAALVAEEAVSVAPRHNDVLLKLFTGTFPERFGSIVLRKILRPESEHVSPCDEHPHRVAVDTSCRLELVCEGGDDEKDGSEKQRMYRLQIGGGSQLHRV